MTNLTAQIEGDFIAMIDEWHSLPETWDNELDAQIHRWYADVLTEKPVYPKKPYFSPSAANACPRELYMKQIGAERDEQKRPPHQARWQRIGTAIGDMLQRDILFIEKHFERLTGNRPPFVFERDDKGRPMFEEFAKKNHQVNYGGHNFYLYGTPDGIMRYTTDNGEIVRVGLEIKSKQTTAAQTSLYTMRNPQVDHIAQATCYSIMYDVDYYLIVYVNAAKSGWVIDEETYSKTPDIRAFCIEINNGAKAAVLDGFADVLDAVTAKEPPALDLERWGFNNYKTACAESLTEKEYEIIKKQVSNAKRSRMPEWKKRSYVEALADIEAIRGKAKE